MRIPDAAGVVLAVSGCAYSCLTRDKAGLVVAFAGVTILFYRMLREARERQPPDPDP